MLSRHADCAYWIGRYVERAEATARTIDVHYHFGLESPYVGRTLTWDSILAISGQEEAYAARYGATNERDILTWFAFDEQNPSSILNCIRNARENGRAIRDQISSEMWEAVNRLYLDYLAWNTDRVLAASPFAFFQRVKNGSHLFQGITSRTLMMGETRDFHDAGRFLERADQTARILDVKYHDLLPRYTGAAPLDDEPVDVGGPIDVHGWMAVLKTVGAYEAYRKTNRQGVTPALVAEFLILNPNFPASVKHSIGRVDRCLRRISGNSNPSPANAAEREVGRLFSELNYLSASEIIERGLHEFLDSVEERCAHIGDAIARTYLRY